MIDQETIERVRKGCDLVVVARELIATPWRREGVHWVTTCPFHVEKSGSFKVHSEEQFFKCFGCGAKGDVFKLVQMVSGVNFGEAVRQLGVRVGVEVVVPVKSVVKGKGRRPMRQVCAYDYLDEKGRVKHVTVRFHYVDEKGADIIDAKTGSAEKTFLQRRPAVKGQRQGKAEAKWDRESGSYWLWTLEGIEPVLFNLPGILKRVGDEVWLVEGEKDALALEEATGWLVTTCPMGAGKWRDSYGAVLRGRRVVLCGDSDGCGVKGMAEVGEALVGVAASVEAMVWPAVVPAGREGEKWDAARALGELVTL